VTELTPMTRPSGFGLGDAVVSIDLLTGIVELHAGARSCEHPGGAPILSELSPEAAARFAELSCAVHRIVRPTVAPLLALSGDTEAMLLASSSSARGTGREG
jgi:hypothetical protein